MNSSPQANLEVGASGPVTYQFSVIPEPGATALLLLGLGGISVRARRRRGKRF